LGHPQANGQMEATKKILMKTLKEKIEDKEGAWVEFLPEVLWSYQTTIWTPMGETPFSLAYASETVIPIEVCLVSILIKHYNLGLNKDGMK
jgi:hypothetical protein